MGRRTVRVAAQRLPTTDRWRRRADDYESRAADFVTVALGHLRSDKPELAAAIFEALVRVDEDDAEAVNNYGFVFCRSTQRHRLQCLIEPIGCTRTVAC